MGLYYNTQTHKCQYYYGRVVDVLTPEPRSLASGQSHKAIPSQRNQHIAAHAEFVPGRLDYWRQQDSFSQNVNREANTDGIKSRINSGTDISTGPKIEQSISNQQSKPPPHAFCDTAPTDNQPRTITYLKDHATLSSTSVENQTSQPYQDSSH
jgi:hypothetical protein